MSQIDRRSFLGTVAVLPAGMAIASNETHARIETLFVGQSDRELLVALAAAILPGELGVQGWTRAAAGFERWLSEFRPGSELNHGYGTDELRHARPDPWPRWQQQLRALDTESARRFNSTFASATPEQRRVLVEATLSGSGAEPLPQALDAEHVALGFLAWFYASSEAIDLCYNARIGKENCRPLDDVANAPRSS
jgi:hypothetical protein